MPGAEMYCSFDGVDRQSTIIATYYMQVDGGADIVSRVRKVSSLIYPGAWTQMATEDQSAWNAHAARVLGIYEAPPHETGLPPDTDSRQFIVQLGIPSENIDRNLASLLTSVAGEILAFGNLKLIDVYFPEDYLRHFQGPKFGVEGIRKLLGVYGRPLLLAIMKPSLGYSPEQGASLFYEAARGGVDIVKDEELLTDPAYCPRTRRVKLYMQAEKRAYEETGEHTLYAVNITDRADRLLANALEAIELGANALMINYFQVGLDATRMVCEDARVTVPILGHNSGAIAASGATHTGISTTLINGKLPRLCGTDLGIVLSGLGSFPVLPERCLLLVREMLSPLHHVAATLPVVASGIVPGKVDMLIHRYSQDIALGAGSSIFGHPHGPAAGARAFRQAIEAAMAGDDLQSAAREHGELGEAIKQWGSS